MAKLRINAHLLEQLLHLPIGVHIAGAEFDAQRGTVVLEIEGPGVPDSEEVRLTVHEPRAELEPLS